MSNLAMIKFEVMIEDINKAVKRSSYTNPSGGERIIVHSNTCLSLIYDMDQLNDFAQVIMQQASIGFAVPPRSKDTWVEKYKGRDRLKDIRVNINAAKDFIQELRKKDNKEEKYKFIFWSLMILAVDKTDAEKHLSAICDFAQMLDVSEDEIKQIIYCVKLVFHEASPVYQWKSEDVHHAFKKLCERYKSGCSEPVKQSKKKF